MFDSLDVTICTLSPEGKDTIIARMAFAAREYIKEIAFDAMKLLDAIRADLTENQHRTLRSMYPVRPRK